MNIRPRLLSLGWYPAKKDAILKIFDEWDAQDSCKPEIQAVSAIAPHAGWYYSGYAAWQAWSHAKDSELVVILGGHIPRGAAFKYYSEDSFETALGYLNNDTTMSNYLAKIYKAEHDTGHDNTIEIHLPMAANKFGSKNIVCFRVPNDERAVDFGKSIAQYAIDTKKSIFVLASTDLTHYGAAYGFEPGGPHNFDWAQAADKRLVSAFIAQDTSLALKLAESEGSACSVGAVLAAMAYAKAIGATKSNLLLLTSSHAVAPDKEARVGYCSITYS